MQSKYQFQGSVVVVNATERVTEKFRKRTFVVCDNDPKYPQYVQFEATQDRCETLDRLVVNQPVVVHFVVNGRKWESKDGRSGFFTTLNALDVQQQTTTQEPTDRFAHVWP